jgi:hypothetical protein
MPWYQRLFRNGPVWFRGWSIGDLDPERHAARQIVNVLAQVIGGGAAL